MSCYKEGKVWRYQFEYKKERYTRSGFPTKKEAVAAREAHKKEVKSKTTVTVSEPTFHEIAYQYLDFSRNHFSEKNWKGKRYVYEQFHAHAKNPIFKDINALMVEKYLETLLPRKANYNRHRKALCSLFAWAFNRQLITLNPCVFVKGMGHIPAKKKDTQPGGNAQDHHGGGRATRVLPGPVLPGRSAGGDQQSQVG